jgi:hypothetical protein
MSSGLALSVVAPPILAALQAHAGLTALVPALRIVDEVPARPTMPYVLVESGSEQPFNTLGAVDGSWGSESRVVVRVVSQYRGDLEVNAVMSQVRAALDGYKFTPTGYLPAIVIFETAQLLKDTIAGVVTRELVAEFSVEVHQ